MRIIVTALAVVACWGFVGAQEKKDEKKANTPYKNEQGGYSIQFPGDAKVKPPENKNSKDGGVMTAVVADCGSGKTCVVVYLDVPDVNKHPKTFFDAAEKAAKDKDGTVTEAKEFVGPKETPGYEFTVACKDGRMLQTRMIVYKTRTYTIVFGADGKTFPADEAKKVLESFTLLK
jgi:hypothetical protein